MEHRCSTRIDTDISVIISEFNKPVGSGLIKNATVFGFYLESVLKVRPLQQIRLEIRMLTKTNKIKKYFFDAIVIHVRADGFGVEIEQMEENNIQDFRKFLLSANNTENRYATEDIKVLVA